MRYQILAYIFIALLAELITDWSQQFIHLTSDSPALYYPDLSALIIARFFVWIPVFFLLSGLWLVCIKLFGKFQFKKQTIVS